MNTSKSRSDTIAANLPVDFVQLNFIGQRTTSPIEQTRSMIIAVFDISVASFHGKVRKVIYVVPPKDLRKKVKIWRLLKSLYATRDSIMA